MSEYNDDRDEWLDEAREERRHEPTGGDDDSAQ